MESKEQLIAVATTDGESIDAEFGKACFFDVYRIEEGSVPSAAFLERRVVPAEEPDGDSAGAQASCPPEPKCSGGRCGGGCSGPASPHLQRRVDTVSDCVCVLCAHAGPGAKKALASKAITLFDIALPVKRALPKVVAWYTRTARLRR